MKIDMIYVDMDGVIADFETLYCSWFTKLYDDDAVASLSENIEHSR